MLPCAYHSTCSPYIYTHTFYSCSSATNSCRSENKRSMYGKHTPSRCIYIYIYMFINTYTYTHIFYLHWCYQFLPIREQTLDAKIKLIM